MSDALFVDPAAAPAAVILVGGGCYVNAGNSSNPPDTFAGDIEAGFATCDACPGSSSSSSSDSSSSSSVPAPCSCPGDLLSTYTIAVVPQSFSYCDNGDEVIVDITTGASWEMISGDPCHWQGECRPEFGFVATVERDVHPSADCSGPVLFVIGPSTHNDVLGGCALDTVNCRWVATIFGAFTLTGYKTTGDTPAGSYSNGITVS